MGKGLHNSDFSFWPMPLVSCVKDQPKLSKSLLVGGDFSDRVMFCLKHHHHHLFQTSRFVYVKTRYNNNTERNNKNVKITALAFHQDESTSLIMFCLIL